MSKVIVRRRLGHLDNMISRGEGFRAELALELVRTPVTVRESFIGDQPQRTRIETSTRESPDWIQWKAEAVALAADCGELAMTEELRKQSKARFSDLDQASFKSARDGMLGTLRACRAVLARRIEEAELPQWRVLHEVDAELTSLLDLEPGSDQNRVQRAMTARVRALEVVGSLLPGSSSPVRTLTTLTRLGGTWKEARRAIEDVQGVIRAVIKDFDILTEKGQPGKDAPLDELVAELRRFRDGVDRICSQRLKPGKGSRARPALLLEDEYDVQDLLFVYLRTRWGRVQEEGPTGKTGGSRSDMDFVLLDHGIALEVKFARPGDDGAKLGKELKEDHFDYLKSQGVKALVVFVAEQAGANARALDDFAGEAYGLPVRVVRVRL